MLTTHTGSWTRRPSISATSITTQDHLVTCDSRLASSSTCRHECPRALVREFA